MITYMLFLLPIASRLALSLGLTLNESPYFSPVGTTTETTDFSSWDRMLNLALIFENCRVLFLGIAVFDIAVSSYCLYKEGGFWGVSDPVRCISRLVESQTTDSIYIRSPQLICTSLHLFSPPRHSKPSSHRSSCPLLVLAFQPSPTSILLPRPSSP